MRCELDETGVVLRVDYDSDVRALLHEEEAVGVIDEEPVVMKERAVRVAEKMPLRIGEVCHPRGELQHESLGLNCLLNREGRIVCRAGRDPVRSSAYDDGEGDGCRYGVGGGLVDESPEHPFRARGAGRERGRVITPCRLRARGVRAVRDAERYLEAVPEIQGVVGVRPEVCDGRGSAVAVAVTWIAWSSLL